MTRAAVVSRRLFSALSLLVALLCGCSTRAAEPVWEASRLPYLASTGWRVSSPLPKTQADAVRMLMVALFGDQMTVEVRIQPSESPESVFVSFDGGATIPLYFSGWNLVPGPDLVTMSATEVALAFAEDVKAAKLFVRDGDTIYSREITASEFQTGTAQLGPRRGVASVLLVGYDDKARPSIILSSDPSQ